MSYLETHKRGVESVGLPTTLEGLNRVIEQYPWFTTARVVMSVERDRSDPRLKMYLTTHPCPTPMLKDVATPKGASNMQLIDAFLSVEHRSVRPNDDTPEYDVAEKSSVIEIDEEIATEELAQIYMAQGFVQQAEEIYSKLKQRKAQ